MVIGDMVGVLHILNHFFNTFCSNLADEPLSELPSGSESAVVLGYGQLVDFDIKAL